MNKNSIQFAKQLGVADCRWHTADTEFDDRIAAHGAGRPLQHEALSGFRLMPELDEVDLTQLKPSIFPDPPLQSQWAAKLGVKNRPRIGLFTSNVSGARRWPLPNWLQLSKMLEGHAELLIFCKPGECDDGPNESALSARWLSTPTTADLIAAMSLLDLVVSADSAPVHIGAALGLPVVALFEARPEKYLRWYPLGVAHRVLYAGPRVESISVSAVHDAIAALLPPMSA